MTKHEVEAAKKRSAGVPYQKGVFTGEHRLNIAKMVRDDVPDLADMLQRAMAYIASTPPPNNHRQSADGPYPACVCARCEDRRNLIAEYEDPPPGGLVGTPG